MHKSAPLIFILLLAFSAPALAVVEEGAQVGAGALVPPGKVVPAGWLVMGVPATPVRQMSPEEIEDILRNAREYVALWRRDYGEK